MSNLVRGAGGYEPYPTFVTSRPDEAVVVAASPDEEIKEYKIHVSSKYIDLTRQKLEVTRLPRELANPGREWWNPKSRVEPLIDHWLEQFSWRDQENELNASVPQFRTGIRSSAVETPIRIHFIHARSPQSNAVPLLLIPPFPFTNLSLKHLIPLFTNPEDPELNQPFHLVIPSLPGTGFSDPLPHDLTTVSTTAEMLDILMKRLGYFHYIITNSGSSTTVPASVDWKIVRHLATHYVDSCLGAHFISPTLTAPKMMKTPMEWMKWQLAGVLGTPMLGYSRADFVALRRNHNSHGLQNGSTNTIASPQLGLVNGGRYDPNTLAYALCDSPTGLLVFFLSIIKALGANKVFTDPELITMTELAWLPGPEGTIRLWAACESQAEVEPVRKPKRKPSVAITVFLEDGPQHDQSTSRNGVTYASSDAYACPAWGNQQYNVLWSDRVPGRPGLLAWDRPSVIVNGTKNLANALLKIDKKLYGTGQSAVVALRQVVVPNESEP